VGPDGGWWERERVRPHVAAAVGQHLSMILDFDGVMFDVRAALGERAREHAVTEVLHGSVYRVRPLAMSFGWSEVHATMQYLNEREPDHGVAAERAVSRLEMRAATTARVSGGVSALLDACAETGRPVGVISDLAEPAVHAALAGHGFADRVAAVAGRRGLDVTTALAAAGVVRVAQLLGMPVGACVVVSGIGSRLHAVRTVGAVPVGCLCGRDRRKHLAMGRTPVVSSLAGLHAAVAAADDSG
jgi:beta-phosphoglucomutase-like phosphatase (HAD superfamily)